MRLQSLCEHLATKGAGEIGVSLFADTMPTECKGGILLMGPYYGVPINQELLGRHRTEFRLVVRSTDWDAGNDLALLSSAILKVCDLQLDRMFVQRMLPLNLPRPYRRSVGGYWEFEVDMDIIYLNQAA